MQIDTSNLTGGIGNVFSGLKGMILGQESGGYSRKWIVLGCAVLAAGFAYWKLPTLTHSKAWDDILGLAKFWLVGQSFVDGMAAFKKPATIVNPTPEPVLPPTFARSPVATSL